jgi:hypothetical protein
MKIVSVEDPSVVNNNFPFGKKVGGKQFVAGLKNQQIYPDSNKQVYMYTETLGALVQMSKDNVTKGFKEGYSFDKIGALKNIGLGTQAGGPTITRDPFITFNFMEITLKEKDIKTENAVSQGLINAALDIGVAAAAVSTGKVVAGFMPKKIKGVANLLGGGVAAAFSANAYFKVKDAWILAQKNMNLEANPNRNTRQMVAMYMPSGVTIQDSAEYEDNSRAVLAAAANISKKGVSQGDLIVAGSMFGKGLMGGGLIAGAAGSLGLGGMGGLATFGEFIQLASDEDMRILGRAMNPNEYKQFKATNLRTFSMNFKFLPDSEKESWNVENIIKEFRTALYPEKNSSISLTVPDLVKIEFHNTGGMVRMPDVYLTSVNITYNPNAASFFRVNQNPVEISMGCEFTEIMPIHREQVQKEGL